MGQDDFPKYITVVLSVVLLGAMITIVAIIMAIFQASSA